MSGTVHGAYKQLGGAVAAGQLVITVNTEGQVVRDPVGNVVFQGPQAVKLNKDGLVTLTLPASDDSTLEPSGFTYAIVEQLSHVARTAYRVVEFQVTNGGTIELADLAATDEAALDPSYGANLNAVLAELDGRLSPTDLAASIDGATVDLVKRDQDVFQWFRLCLTLSAAGQSYANVAAIGTSLTEGEIVSAPEKKWTRVLQALLRGLFQPAGVPGGEGYVPSHYAGPVVSPNTAMVDRWTLSSGAFEDDTYFGLGYRAIGIPNTKTATMVFSGTGLDLLYAKGSAGTASVTVDGVSQGTINGVIGSGFSGGNVKTIRNLAPGQHTVVVTGTDAAGSLYLEGAVVYNGDETAGVRVIEAGHAGINSAGLNAQDYPYQSLGAVNPQVVFLEPLANDYLQAVNTTTAKGYVLGVIAKIKAHVDARCAIVLVITPGQSTDTGGTAWDAYAQKLYDIAAADARCVVLDLRKYAGPIYGDPNTLVYIDGGGSYDSLHLNDRGNAAWAAAAMDLLNVSTGSAKPASTKDTSATILTNAMLSNSWTQWTATTTHTQGSYRKSLLTGEVVLEGMLSAGTIGTNTVLTNLPPGFRPAKTVFGRAFYDGGIGTLIVDPNGNVSIQGVGGASSYLYMDARFVPAAA